jgi:hypothetical protein
MKAKGLRGKHGVSPQIRVCATDGTET